MAGLIGDLDGTVVQRAAMQQLLAQDFPAGTDRLAPRRVGIGQVLALLVAAEVGAFADMEVMPSRTWK